MILIIIQTIDKNEINIGKKVFKNFDKVEDRIFEKVKIIIKNLEKYNDIGEIYENFDIKKMSLNSKYFRIRVGNYRLGLLIGANHVKIIRFLHRKDIYKKFPK